jgi:methyltransferase (TIGR00027 family)
MREGRPSQTASMVAMFRALADRGLTTAQGFSDPVARELLSPGWSRLLRRFERWMERLPADRRAQVALQLDMIPLRVLAIDAELRQAVAGGCGQVVILGAGLDSRAWRMEELEGVHLFEVDHPATQGFKRERVAALRPRAGQLSFVAVHFERDRLDERLRAAGYRDEEPAAFVWEGVIMYLTDAGMRSTLGAVAALSAPKSRLIAHYHEPDGVRRALWRGVLRVVWREPHIGDRTREVMRAEVEQAGLHVASDTGAAEWAERFGARPPATLMVARNRLLVAIEPG